MIANISPAEDAKTLLFSEAKRIAVLLNGFDKKYTEIARMMLNLREMYIDVYGKPRGFNQWAASLFKRSAGNISHLIWVARHPERHEENERIRTQTKTAMEVTKQAFCKLDKHERNRFLIWATNSSFGVLE